MKYLIVVRRTEDWGNMNTEKLRDKILHFSGLPEDSDEHVNGPRFYYTESSKATWDWQRFLRFIEEWDEQLLLSYCQYRNALWQIAQESWERAGLEWIKFTTIEELPKDDSLILLPSDDDDVYAPNIISGLEKHFKSDALVWRATKYYPVVNNITQVDANKVVGSNCYALRSTAVRYETHILTHRLGVDDIEHHRVNNSYSVQICHPASVYQVSHNGVTISQIRMMLERWGARKNKGKCPRHLECIGDLKWFEDLGNKVLNLTRGIIPLYMM